MKLVTTAGIAAMAVALVLAFGSQSWADDRFSKRQERQIRRIAKGFLEGTITREEYFRLTKEQQRIKRARLRAWEDGRLSPRERRRLYYMLDRASDHIYRARHTRRCRARKTFYYFTERHIEHCYPAFGWVCPEPLRHDRYGFRARWSEPGWSFSISTLAVR
ncbi:MAG: hypothetical protein JRH13_14980 [Deltaproteobacteria bacterium]|nr:hypothetical protein [Deltaproteobacteria bacterium]MBW2304708.1 hypothetical protein [Deltaproteobacteria bacterium]